MNLLLIEDHELAPDGTARLTGRRAVHAREVLKAHPGEQLRAGVLGGQMGTAKVLSSSREELVLELELTSPPPPRAGIDLLLAIPRPKALKKVLPAATSLGVDRIVLVNAYRVEKSYFDSKVLAPDFLRELLVLGLEQARDTRVPELLIRERFRPFVEDELDATFPGTRRLLPHPIAAQSFATVEAPRTDERVVLAIGPEGGWIDFEVQLLQAQGFVPITLGNRILRVETCVSYLIGQTQLWRAMHAPVRSSVT